MPQIGAPEILLVAVIALIVFGPRRLPEIARSMGRSLAEFKRHASDLRSEFEAGLDDPEDEKPAPGEAEKPAPVDEKPAPGEAEKPAPVDEKPAPGEAEKPAPVEPAEAEKTSGPRPAEDESPA